jgi:deoxyribodipyrimidine photo-lyase
MSDTALLWLRRDLRVHDHPALMAARDRAETVVPVFCFDPRLLGGRHRSASRTQFLLECLEALQTALEQRGGGLVIRHGPPERELPALAREVGAHSVFASRDVGPYARRRDETVTRALAADEIEMCWQPGLFVSDDPAAIRTGQGGPYTVFTPFYRAWRALPRRDVLGAPPKLPALPRGLERGRLPRLSDFGLEQEVSDPATGGEPQGRRAMQRLHCETAASYRGLHDVVGDEGTSRLSPYLHFGCVSARELEHGLPGGEGPEAFQRQLCWRDFYAQVLRHFPGNARSEHQERYRSSLRWSHAQPHFEAWCDGRTGYPLVDAGMRQLRREGWMHNRARLVVGSFLTKDLGIDWRWGERWFMRLLIDGDEASNNGNWQWIASVGVDPQPPYRRIYNPARHQERLDPKGVYVRRYVPELRDVPDEHLAEPWTMPAALQAEVGCVIGRDYPEPIVDHLAARRAALERYAAIGSSRRRTAGRSGTG